MTASVGGESSHRTEGIVQIAIMLAIGGAAGAASFTHVHNVAAAHGQSGWIAWADAIVLELMSVASGLELRRRKRYHAPLRLPAAVLGCATALSISAQVVEAERSAIGWVAAALPALGFLVMVKMALGRSSNAHTSTATADAVVAGDTAAAASRSAETEPFAVAATASKPPEISWLGASLRDGDEDMQPVLNRRPPQATRRATARTQQNDSTLSRKRRVTAGLARESIKVPATASTLLRWAETWIAMCADGLGVLGPLNDDQRARASFELTAKQLRNIRNAVLSGALRRKAAELGVTLPAAFTETPGEGDSLAAAA